MNLSSNSWNLSNIASLVAKACMDVVTLHVLVPGHFSQGGILKCISHAEVAFYAHCDSKFIGSSCMTAGSQSEVRHVVLT